MFSPLICISGVNSPTTRSLAYNCRKKRAINARLFLIFQRPSFRNQMTFSNICIYAQPWCFMLIRYVKSHVGHLLDSDGYDIYGKHIDVPALLRDGEHKYSKYRGLIDAFECNSLQRVKLVGFTEYSFDDGKHWIEIPYNHYVVGVRKWSKFYVVLFNGNLRVYVYTPKEPERYYNNVHYI